MRHHSAQSAIGMRVFRQVIPKKAVMGGGIDATGVAKSVAGAAVTAAAGATVAVVVAVAAIAAAAMVVAATATVMYGM